MIARSAIVCLGDIRVTLQEVRGAHPKCCKDWLPFFGCASRTIDLEHLLFL